MDEYEKACDGVEKFVMMRLHERVFAADSYEVQEDEDLGAWMRRLRFLTPAHLGISPDFRDQEPWASAQQELTKIAQYKTPRDKARRTLLRQTSTACNQPPATQLSPLASCLSRVRE